MALDETLDMTAILTSQLAAVQGAIALLDQATVDRGSTACEWRGPAQSSFAVDDYAFAAEMTALLADLEAARASLTLATMACNV